MSEVTYGTPQPGVAYFRLYPERTWTAPGYPSLDGGSDSWVDPFILGTTKPTQEWVGTGLVRPVPDPEVFGTVINGDQIIGVSQTIKDKIFNGYVTVQNAALVTFENCIMKGPVAAATTGKPIVTTTRSTLTTLKFCDVYAQTPSAYLGGVGYKNYRTERCNVWDVTDGFAAFVQSTDPDPKCNIAIMGTWCHDLSRFAPDYATNNRAETHNDCIQLQGNVGPADDILIDGSWFDAYHSQLVGDQPVVHKQISAIMLTPNTKPQVSITVRRSWMSGGQYTFNAGLAQPLSTIVMEDVRWEKPHANGPALAIGIDPSITNRAISGMVYEVDGTPVPINNA